MTADRGDCVADARCRALDVRDADACRALAGEVQVALTLRTVCGLTTAEVARAFLIGEDAMAQRLPVTLALSAYALVLTLVIGVGSGVGSAMWPSARPR